MTLKTRTDYNPTILSRAGLQNVSHVHTTRIVASVTRERCARCGVQFTHSVAQKGIAIDCDLSNYFATLVASTRLKRKKKIETNLEGAVGIAFV